MTTVLKRVKSTVRKMNGFRLQCTLEHKIMSLLKKVKYAKKLKVSH